MTTRSLLALVLSAFLLDPANAAVMTGKPDALFGALLKSNLANLPAGVSAAHLGPAKVDGEDKTSGVLANVQITFDGEDPSAKVNYLMFATPGLASNYLKRFNQMLMASGAPRKLLPSVPGADCADAIKVDALICMSAISRVIVFSYGANVRTPVDSGGTEPSSLAGPLMKLAVDHLTAVRAATGTQ